MVVYFAIKELDDEGKPDDTCTKLVQQIGQNCHGIVVDMTVKERYDLHLSELLSHPQYMTRTVLFLSDFVYNPAKFIIETGKPPKLPAGVKLPREDKYVVRAALISRPVIVTAEKKLLKAINTQPALKLKALTPAEALELAKQS
jgi:hypothetical protein